MDKIVMKSSKGALLPLYEVRKPLDWRCRTGRESGPGWLKSLIHVKKYERFI